MALEHYAPIQLTQTRQDLIREAYENRFDNMVRNGPRIPLKLQSLFVAAATGKDEPETQGVLSPVKRSQQQGAEAGLSNISKLQRALSPRKPSRRDHSQQTKAPSPTKQPKRSSSDRAHDRHSPRKQSHRQASARLPSPRKHSKRYTQSIPTLTPQDYLDGLMLNRGYAIERFDVPFCPPTPLQLVTHTAYVVEAAKRDPEKLRSLIEAGLSPNCCNVHGDALLNMVCRRGLTATLRVLIDCGSRFDVSAGDGLTPLHEACWNSPPNFPLVDIILRHAGSNVFHMKDKKGFVPLQYTSIDDWDCWLRFLESRKNIYWPEGGRKDRDPNQERCRIEPLPITLAEIVAKGNINPEDVWMFLDDGESSVTTDTSGQLIGFRRLDESDSNMSCSSSSLDG